MTQGWRKSSELFKRAAVDDVFAAGTMEMSPAWFSQGNTVGDPASLGRRSWLTAIQGKASELHVSQTLQEHAKNGSLDWLAEMEETTDLLNAILSVVHPELYRAGEAALKKLRHAAEFAKHHTWARSWSSVYSGVSVIANRACVPHRDPGGRPDWFDMIVTLGQYCEATMCWPDLDVTLDYLFGVGQCCAWQVRFLRVSLSYIVLLCISF